MTLRFDTRRAIARGLITLVAFGLASPSHAEPAAKPSAFAHLATRDGAPPWTFDSIAAAVPAGPAMAVEPNKPIAHVDDPAAAVRAALARLRTTDAASHEVAFRIAGAAANQTKDPAATKLFVLMQHDGIGTRIDAAAAVRSALALVRIGDADACAYVGAAAPKSLFATAKPAATLALLRKMPDPTAVKLTLPITVDQPLKVGGKATGRDADAPLPVDVQASIEDLQVGRVVNLAGVWANGAFTAFAGDVPKPVLAYKWKLVRKPVIGGSWQVQTIKVAVQNQGVQPVRLAKFKVRCYVHNGGLNDYTRDAECKTVAPGATVSVDVNFEMFNYQILEAAAEPTVEVTTDGMEW